MATIQTSRGSAGRDVRPGRPDVRSCAKNELKAFSASGPLAATYSLNHVKAASINFSGDSSIESESTRSPSNGSSRVSN